MSPNEFDRLKILRLVVPMWLALSAFGVVQAGPNGWDVVAAPQVSRSAAGGRLAARTALEKGIDGLSAHAGDRYRIIVKFQDAVTARVNLDKKTVTVARGVDVLAPVVARHDLTFEPLLTLPEKKLADLEMGAAHRSGHAQPDMMGILIARASDEDADTVLSIARDLAELSIVEYVELVNLSNPPPPPGDIPPTTPDLTSHQGYVLTNPGIDAAYAWSRGIKGDGVRVSDCEYGFNTNHEDLTDEMIAFEPGQTVDPYVISKGWDSHGTAVLGEMTASDNAYGMRGLASDANYHFFPEYCRRTTAIANAIAGSGFGDIVVLEMQTTGASGAYVPAEYSLTVWNLVKLATDAGILVVAAAGNGAENLDSAAYAAYRARGDSGAIIVGAGSASSAHNTLYFSTYGSRVNVQGWGESVASLGYGTFAEYGGDKNQRYRTTFNGTSSATPIVSSACVLIQSYCQQAYGFRLGPLAMRQLLIDTGVAQGSGGHIGPLPDVRAAMLYLDGDSDGDTMATWWELKHFTNGTAALPTDDADGDGEDNIAEWTALSDPTNQSASLVIANISYEGNRPVLYWEGSPARNYGISWSSNLVTEFTGLAGSIRGITPGNVYTDMLHSVGHSVFYRLDVSIPPVD